MAISGIGSGALNMQQSQAQWDAIVQIKSTTPFASAGGSAGSAAGVGSTLDAIADGYVQRAAGTGAAGNDVQAAIWERISAAQGSTIDLFA